MSKRIAPSILNMVKRLRFSMDEMDIYLQPEETPSSTETSLLKDASSTIKEEKSIKEEKPSPIKYQDGFPKLLFQDLQSNNSTVVLNATMELDSLLGGCPEKLQNEFLPLGGHAVLITTMQKWTHHGVIQSHLCRCIAGMIATYNKTKSAAGLDLVSSLLLMGALDQITVGALLKYPTFPSIQLDAMHAVSHLCGGTSSDAAKRFVRELDGVSLVTKAMRVYAGIEDVQEQGCRLLNTLCRAGEHEEAVAIKNTALTVVAASVQSYPDNPSIEKDAHDLMNAVLSGEMSEGSD